MSWSASFDIVDGDVVNESLKESNINPEYHNDQYEESLRAVWKLIWSGTFGDPEGNYKVTLSGHGNPNHVPISGWGNDFIQISISQV